MTVSTGREWDALRLTIVAALALAPALLCAQVSGTVVDGGGAPIAGAWVTLQATDTQTTTDPAGAFSFPTLTGTDLVLVGAAAGYYEQGTVVPLTPATGVVIQLQGVPPSDSPDYVFMDPVQCGFCHSSQLDQWQLSRMALTGLNTWVYDLYNGTGTPGGMNGFVYVFDSVHGATNPESECASCHQPERWIRTPHAALGDLANPDEAMLRGVYCDICHKTADVDPGQISTPGYWPGAHTFTRPDPAAPIDDQQVEYGVLGDVTFVSPGAMRASYQPQLPTLLCAVCHETNNDPDEDGDFIEPGSVPAQTTYSEWLASPYGADPQSPDYRSCTDCHTQSFGATAACDFPPQPFQRDPETIRSMEFRGTTAEYLENAVTLGMTTNLAGGEIQVDVTIANDQTGHSVPTGVTERNVVLLVEAIRQEDGLRLALAAGPTIDGNGGVGDPALGYYAGLAGRIYARINHDASGAGPVFFTEATGILSDTRIAAGASDLTSYSFAVPATGGTIDLRARLIYRRAWRALVDAKGWTEDGLGNPLEDLAPPHYGHLMEEAADQIVLPFTGVLFSRGDCNADTIFNIADAIFGLDVLFGGGGVNESCTDACDANDDGGFDIADMIYILGRLFGGGPPPLPPFPGCGTDDATPDGLDCQAPTCP